MDKIINFFKNLFNKKEEIREELITGEPLKLNLIQVKEEEEVKSNCKCDGKNVNCKCGNSETTKENKTIVEEKNVDVTNPKKQPVKKKSSTKKKVIKKKGSK